MNVEIIEITRRLERQRNHFTFYEFLLEREGHPTDEMRRFVLFGWADEMAFFQEEADRVDESIDYFQRGEVIRTLHPVRRAA